jgi:hypothetical protein
VSAALDLPNMARSCFSGSCLACVAISALVVSIASGQSLATEGGKDNLPDVEVIDMKRITLPQFSFII